MNNIKLTKTYSLIISRLVTKKEILDFINNKIGKNMTYCIDGSYGSYIVVIRDCNNNYETSLDISVKKLSNIFITTISQDVEGEELQGKELFNENAYVLDKFCEEYSGVLVTKHYKVTRYSNLYKTCYAINYDKDTIEYKLFSLFVNDSKDIYEVLAFTELLKKNKSQLLDILDN